MSPRRPIGCAAVCVAALILPSAAHACGTERWPVKTLTDQRARLVNLTPRRTTVDALRGKRVVRDARGRRARGVERTTYRVTASLVGFKTEEDGDVHLVIAAPGRRSHTMIVELPDGACTRGAAPDLRRRMSRALAAIRRACGSPTGAFTRLTGTATVTGVGFFDAIHGQTGVAPNGIELHPVLSFSSRSCRPWRPGGAG